MNKISMSQTCLYNISYKKATRYLQQPSCYRGHSALVQHNTNFAIVHSRVTVGGNLVECEYNYISSPAWVSRLFSQCSITSTKCHLSLNTSTLPIHKKAITSCLQGWRVFRISCQSRSFINARNDLSFTSVFYSQNHPTLGFSDIPSDTSQLALKQSYTEETNRQNNNGKVKKPTLGSHSFL